MSFISDGTIDSLRAIHSSAMMDECRLLGRYDGGPDAYNMPEPDSYVFKATLPCLFRPVRASEAMSSTEVPTLDAMVSFDHDIEIQCGITITNLDRIRLTKLHGDAVEAQDYEIAGDIERDNLAIILPLKKVTDE